MSDTDARQTERMSALLAAQKQAFARQRHRSHDDRMADLTRLADMVKARADAFADAIDADYGRRAKAETQIGEVGFMLAAIKHAKKHLKGWMADQPADVPLTLKPGKAYVRREPLGVAGIIAPWNYPMQLALAPLAAALSAGCRAMIKPSEYTPRTAELLKQALGEIYPEDQVAVITGGPSVGEAFTRLKFDHLFYTGSTKVGRLVALAAADNLVPVTLELGGKSPAVIAPDFDVAEAAKTLAWGKFFNAGQTCVAPDFVMTPKGSQDKFAQAVMDSAAKYWPDPAANPDYTGIVSEPHYSRLRSMVEEARSAGATVLEAEPGSAAGANHHAFPPTVVVDPPLDGALMTEEIFGPVLPVIGHAGLEDAASFLERRDRPLALYVYAKKKATARDFLARTISGGAAVNVPLLHLSVEDLPFGGVGASGHGAYHGERGFLTFTHERGVFEAPVKHPSRMMAPPYGRMFRLISKLQGG